MLSRPHPQQRWLDLANEVFLREWQLLGLRDSLFGPRLFRRDELAACNQLARRLWAAEVDFMQGMRKHRHAPNDKDTQAVPPAFWMSELRVTPGSGPGPTT